MRFFRQAVVGASSSRQQPATTAPEVTNTPGDVEAGPSGLPVPGLTFRSSSRSSSPCAGLAVRSPQSDNGRQEFLSPRAERTQQSFTRSLLFGSSPSQSPTKPGSRGKERQFCLLLLLLLPAVTGLAVLGVRLRMSEAEHHSVSNMPSPGRFNTIRWDGSGNPKSSSSFPSASASSRSSSNSRVSLVDDEPDGIFPTFKSKQSYQEMRDRIRDPLPSWARTCVEAVRKLLKTDPVLKYLLSEGPAAWTWKWLFHGKRNPAQLWDTSEFGPKAKYQWGSGDQLCSILNATDDIALVGNGPLTDEQRQQISQAGRVVRFNALNNRIPGEQIDVWLVRYNGMGPANYWGFKQLRYTEAEEVVRQASGVVFLGGHPTRFMAYAVEELLTWYPFVPVEKSMQINITGYWDLYNQVLSDSTSLKRAGAMPSSGLLGVLTTVACMRPDQKLRIFGFNWNPQNWFMHKMSAEQKIIHRLLAGRQVEINPTACDGMYTCHKLCDHLFYRLAKDGDKSTCEERAKEEKERQEKEDQEQKARDRQRAMDGLYGSTSYHRQAALQASAGANKVPDWVLDGSIKFNGNAGKAADSVGMTSDVKNGITLIGLRDTALPMAVEEREDGFLYNEHGERLGSTDTLGGAATSAILQGPEERSTSGIQQLAAEELLAMAADDVQDVDAHIEPLPEDDYSDEDFLMEAQNLPEQGNVGEGEQEAEAAQQAQEGNAAGAEADAESSAAQNEDDMEVEDEEEEEEEQASLAKDEAHPAAAAEDNESQQTQQGEDSAEAMLEDDSSEVQDAGVEEEVEASEQDDEAIDDEEDEEGVGARRLLWDSQRRFSRHLLAG